MYLEESYTTEPASRYLQVECLAKAQLSSDPGLGGGGNKSTNLLGNTVPRIEKGRSVPLDLASPSEPSFCCSSCQLAWHHLDQHLVFRWAHWRQRQLQRQAPCLLQPHLWPADLPPLPRAFDLPPGLLEAGPVRGALPAGAAAVPADLPVLRPPLLPWAAASDGAALAFAAPLAFLAGGAGSSSSSGSDSAWQKWEPFEVGIRAP